MEPLRNAAIRLFAALRSRGSLPLAITVIGSVGAVLVFVSEFTTIAAIEIGSAGCDTAAVSSQDACQVSGLEQHGGAFLLLGVLALVMALGAGRGSSRPAAIALIVVGVIVLAVVVVRDLPKTSEEGLIGINYDDAKAGPGAGFSIEIVGGVLCLVAGGLGLAYGRARD